MKFKYFYNPSKNRPKLYLGLLGGLMLAVSQQALAETSLATTTKVEIFAEQIPQGMEQLWKLRAEAALELIEKQILPTLPLNVAQLVDGHRFRILLKTKTQTDGLFVAPSSSFGTLPFRIEINQELITSRDLNALLAHEIFHALHFALHPNEEPWVREGLAQYFEYLSLNERNGKNIEAAFLNPTTALMGEYDHRSVVPEQYGHDFLFFYYLMEQCGGVELFWKLARGTEIVYGSQGVDRALADSKGPAHCSTFKTSATSFELARIHYRSRRGADAPSQYYLWATSLPMATPLESVTFETLRKLPRFAPLPLSANCLLPMLMPLGLKTYWLHRDYPYEIQDNAPAAADPSWIKVILKL